MPDPDFSAWTTGPPADTYVIKHDEKPDVRACSCGQGNIAWRPYPPLPFPEVASEAQLERQARGGRWVHTEPNGEYDEWCPVRRPYPATGDTRA